MFQTEYNTSHTFPQKIYYLQKPIYGTVLNLFCKTVYITLFGMIEVSGVIMGCFSEREESFFVQFYYIIVWHHYQPSLPLPWVASSKIDTTEIKAWCIEVQAHWKKWSQAQESAKQLSRPIEPVAQWDTPAGLSHRHRRSAMASWLRRPLARIALL
jgi:hypothetical protein